MAMRTPGAQEGEPAGGSETLEKARRQAEAGRAVWTRCGRTPGVAREFWHRDGWAAATWNKDEEHARPRDHDHVTRWARTRGVDRIASAMRRAPSSWRPR